MRFDTPPPDEDSLSEGRPSEFDDIEIIEEYEIDVPQYTGDFKEAKLTYTGHAEAVFSCAFDKSGQYVVTGGQDDKAFIWNPVTGETIFECTEHRDSVFCADFSYDSKYVATGDMSGIVQVWKLSDTSSTVFHHDVAEDLKLLVWNNTCNVLFAGVGDGNCWMWHIPSGRTKVFQGTGIPCSSGVILSSGLVSVVGYEDGSIRFFDLKTTTTQHTITGHMAHEEPVTTLASHPDDTVVITGSTDGTAKVIKSTDGKVLFTLRCEPDDLPNKSVEGVSFFASHPLVATGTVCGSLAIWDVPTQVRRLQCEQESGITKLVCDKSLPMVYTSGLDGVVRLTDGRTGQQEKVWGKHTAAVLDFNLSSDGNTLVTASDDATCKIFDIRT